MKHRDEWKGDVHVYDYTAPERLPDRDAFKLAEAFIHDPNRSGVALDIVVAVTGPGTKRSGFTWDRAFADGRALRDRLVEEYRAEVESLTESRTDLHFLP
jgi:hypothetical protein